MVFTQGFESLRCLHANIALASGVHTLVYRPRGVDGLGTGLHLRGPVRPALPVIAEKSIGDAHWFELRRKQCRLVRQPDGTMRPIGKLCNSTATGGSAPGTGIPHFSPKKIAPVDTRALEALLLHAAGLIGRHRPATFHA